MLEKGKILDGGRYVISKKIGSGGFGAVYLAEDTRFSGNNRVAVKQISNSNDSVAKTSKIEADLLYHLKHANLPKVTDCFQEEGANFIVMDYVSGEDLAQGLLRKRVFTVEEILNIADKVLDALEYLHSFPIYHRDIKPHNIKIDENGSIFLLDFGTAKGNTEEAATLQLGGQSITGFTPFYAPLEQVLRVDANSYLLLSALNSEKLEEFAKRKTDARSDIYSLGATLYHLLTGFSHEQATATIRAHAFWSDKPDPLPNIRKLNPQIPPALANSIHRALEVMPENRFQTATEFRQNLKTAQTDFDSENLTEPLSLKDDFQSIPLAPTQISLQNITQDETVSFDAPEFDFVPNVPPKPKTNKFIYIGLSVVLFFILAGISAVLIWSLTKEKAVEVNKNTDTNQTIAKGDNSSRNSAGNNTFPANDDGENPEKALDYSLTVQKMRDGKKFQDPFESSGQEIYENGYQFVMNFTPSETGFLYIFAEGLNDKNEKVFNIIFPTPLRNDGKPDVSANKKYETGENEFGGKPGTENFWVVWSREKSETPEKAMENAFANGGKVSDKDSQSKLKEFLESRKNTKSAFKDTEKKMSKIGFEGDSVVHLIQLEHR